MIELTLLLLIWIAMIFMHIVDDYYLQGILSKMKTKSWWKEQPGYNDLYIADYLMALYEHAFSWSCCIHIPLIGYIIYTSNIGYQYPSYICYLLFASILINAIIHGIIDNLKANALKINLIQDQLYHLVQISITWIIYVIFIGKVVLI